MNIIQKFLSIKRKKIAAPELKLIDSETPFAIRQAYKALCTNILYLNTGDKCKKIAVTSAIPSECKSTVSSNLALTLAQNLAEKRILFVDCDMHSPKSSRMFGFERDIHGLSEYLVGIDAEPNFQTYHKYNLTILSAGGKSANPTKLIGSQKMKSFLELCEEKFDYVIIDTSPVNVISDALLLNGLVGGYVISARADHSDINSVSECVEAMNQIGAEIFGIVLSDLKLKSTDTKYGKYGKYGKYNKYSVYQKEDTLNSVESSAAASYDE